MIHYHNDHYGTVIGTFSIVIAVAIQTIIININIGHMVHKHWSHGSLEYSIYASVS